MVRPIAGSASRALLSGRRCGVGGGVSSRRAKFLWQHRASRHPEFLASYGLDPNAYGRYGVSTQYNIPGTVRFEGVSFSYRQSLTFLPRWARGFEVFANGTSQRAVGDTGGNFAGYIPRSGSAGLSFTREKYNLRVNANHRGARG